MPVKLSFDTTLPPKLDVNVGAKSHFFQPPRSPSLSSSACGKLHKSTTPLSIRDGGIRTGRKRSRHDSFAEQITTHSSPSHTWSMASDPASSGLLSPQPLVNTRYELAGGLESPMSAAQSGMDPDNEDRVANPDSGMRGGRGFRDVDPTLDSYFPHSSSALAREGNGRPRVIAAPGIRDGLGRAVYSVVGVAGKVLQFCKATAFRGFYAGGGQGYEIKPPCVEDSIWLDSDGAKSLVQTTNDVLPGRFPEEDYIPDYMSYDHTTSPRATKKVQRDKGVGDLSASWVVVGSRETSPSRLSRRKVPSTSTSSRKPAPRLGKRPILPASRPSLTSNAGSPGMHYDRPASFASARSPMSSPKRESPVSIEMQRHAARMRRRELEEDANLKRLNSQLKAMIKEGKEALGTRFDVEEEEPIDEGYAEGDFFLESGKG